MKVFCFKIRFEYDDPFDKQERYVLANTEEEAIEKMLQYRTEMIKKGTRNFIFSFSPTVELENVIV